MFMANWLIIKKTLIFLLYKLFFGELLEKMVQCIGKPDVIRGFESFTISTTNFNSASMAVIKDFFFSSDQKNEIICFRRIMSMDTENDSPK